MPKIACAQCGEQISGRYFENKNKESLCRSCAEQNAGFCLVCQQTMLGSKKGVKIEGCPVHKECFNCVDCHEPIGATGFQLKSKLCVDDSRRALFGTKDFVCATCAKTFRKNEKRMLRDKAAAAAGADAEQEDGYPPPPGEVAPAADAASEPRSKGVGSALREMNEAVQVAAGNVHARPVSEETAAAGRESGDISRGPTLVAPLGASVIAYDGDEEGDGPGESASATAEPNDDAPAAPPAGVGSDRLSQKIRDMQAAVINVHKPMLSAFDSVAPTTPRDYHQDGVSAPYAYDDEADEDGQGDDADGYVGSYGVGYSGEQNERKSKRKSSNKFTPASRTSRAASRTSRPSSRKSRDKVDQENKKRASQQLKEELRASLQMRCAACQKQIGRDEPTCKTGAGVTFHADCFKCSKCENGIQGSFVRGAQGKLICQKCIPQCGGCGLPLSGKVLSANGKAYHVEHPKTGECCLQCQKCSKSLLNGFFDHPEEEDTVICAGCYSEVLESSHNAAHEKDHAESRARHASVELHHGCYWHPRYAGRSADMLKMFEETTTSSSARGSLPQKEKLDHAFEQAAHADSLCVVLEEADLSLKPAADPERGAVNLEYLAQAAQLFAQNGKTEPAFSLEPFEEGNVRGPWQVKKFAPALMVDTPFGEVLFQADYFLKKCCFGEVALPESFGAHLFDLLDAHPREEVGVRQWFVIRNASVTVSVDNVLLPDCDIEVRARHFGSTRAGGSKTKNSKYVDVRMPGQHDVASQHAATFTAHMKEIVAATPEMQELEKVCKAMVLVKYLHEHKGMEVTAKALKFPHRSVLEDINTVREQERGVDALKNYQLKIPTLQKVVKLSAARAAGGSRKKSKNLYYEGAGVGVEEGAQDSVSVTRVEQTIFGGIDLTVEEIAEKQSSEVVGASGTTKLSFPLMSDK